MKTERLLIFLTAVNAGLLVYQMVRPHLSTAATIDVQTVIRGRALEIVDDREGAAPDNGDRKSTRLNSSHDQISYAVFCLKKKIQTPGLSYPVVKSPTECPQALFESHIAFRQSLSDCSVVFFFNDTATTEIYTLSLHDALPISSQYGSYDRRTDRYPGPRPRDRG